MKESFDESKRIKKKRKKRRASKSSSVSARSLSKETESYPPRQKMGRNSPSGGRERQQKTRELVKSRNSHRSERGRPLIRRICVEENLNSQIFERETYRGPGDYRLSSRSLRNPAEGQKAKRKTSHGRSGSGRRQRKYGSRSKSPSFRNNTKPPRRHRSRFDDSPFVANGSRKKKTNAKKGIEYFPDLGDDQGSRKTRFDRAPTDSRRDRRKDRRRRSKSPRSGKYPSRSPRSGSSTPTSRSSRSKQDKMKCALYDFSDLDLQRDENAKKDGTKEEGELGSDDEFNAEKFYEEDTRQHDSAAIRQNTSLKEVINIPDHGKLSPGIKPPKGDGHFPKEIVGIKEVTAPQLQTVTSHLQPPKVDQITVAPEIPIPAVKPTDPRVKPKEPSKEEIVAPPQPIENPPAPDQLSDMDMSDSETEKDAKLLEEVNEADSPAVVEKAQPPPALPKPSPTPSKSHSKKHKRTPKASIDESSRQREEKKKKKKRKRSKDVDRKKLKERKRHKHHKDADSGGKSSAMKLRNGNVPDQFCICIDGINEDANEELIYKSIEAVEGLRDTKIYTGKSCRFVLCDFESKESMRSFWQAAHCGKHGVDRFGFQVEVFEDPFGLISTKVFTLLNSRIKKKSTDFKCSATAYIPSDPLLCMTHSKYFAPAPSEQKSEAEADSEIKTGESKSDQPEQSEKEATEKQIPTSPENSTKENDTSMKSSQPEAAQSKAEEVEEMKIDIPTNMFAFRPPDSELVRKEPTPEPKTQPKQVSSPISTHDSIDVDAGTAKESESKPKHEPKSKENKKKSNKNEKSKIPEVKKKRKSKRNSSITKKKRKSDPKVSRRRPGRPRKKTKTSPSPRPRMMPEAKSAFPLDLVKDVGKAFTVNNTTSTEQSDDIVASLKAFTMSFSSSANTSASVEEVPKKPVKKPLLPRRKRKAPAASEIVSSSKKSKPEISSKPPKRKRQPEAEHPQRKRKKTNGTSPIVKRKGKGPVRLEPARVVESESEGEPSDKKDPVVLKKLAESGFQRSVYAKIQSTFPRRILSWEAFSTVTDEEFRLCDLNDMQIAILRALTAEHVDDPIQAIPKMQMPSATKPRKHENGCLRCEPYTGRQSSNAANRQHWAKKAKVSAKKERHRRRVQSSEALLRVNSLSFRTKNLKFEKSLIHSWGVFAMEIIERNEQVVEYMGEYISPEIADERQAVYQENNIDDYMFRANDDVIIDGTMKGNIARFVNHSCDPNCYTRPLLVDDTPRVVIYAKRQILAGEELTYDYKFPLEEVKIPCHCGAKSCRGFLN